jgi:hypothetical protein
MRKSAALVIAMLALSSPAAFAQSALSERLVLEPVAAVNTSSDLPDDPFVFLDLTATTRIGRGFDVIVRPWVRRLPGGDWSKEMYQLEVRYQSETRVPFRIDAGIISSPLGLGTLQLRPDLNATVSTPSYFFVPLPSFDGYRDGVVLMSGGYPLGAILSSSGERWDARVGITDGTVARTRKLFHSGPSPAAQFIAGGGWTLAPGFRVGAGFAQGRYRSASDLSTLPKRPGAEGPARVADATVFNIEGEAAFGYTTLNGEWIRDRFETAGAPAVARGLRLEAVRTLTPHLFVAARTVRVVSPAFTPSGREQRTLATLEASAGYRLTPDVTVRGGYQGTRSFGVTDWDHAAVTSIVFSRRWF